MKCVTRILIAYHSLTGNTKKIAQSLYEGCIPLGAADISTIEEISPDILEKYDIAFIGSPCHAGDLSQVARDFLSSMKDSLPVTLAGFFTHSAPVYKEKDYINCVDTFTNECAQKGISLSGVFHCMGFLTPELHGMIKKARGFSDAEWNEMVNQMKGHPDNIDISDAQSFAAAILTSYMEKQK